MRRRRSDSRGSTLRDISLRKVMIKPRAYINLRILSFRKDKGKRGASARLACRRAAFPGDIVLCRNFVLKNRECNERYVYRYKERLRAICDGLIMRARAYTCADGRALRVAAGRHIVRCCVWMYARQLSEA